MATINCLVIDLFFIIFTYYTSPYDDLVIMKYYCKSYFYQKTMIKQLDAQLFFKNQIASINSYFSFHVCKLRRTKTFREGDLYFLSHVSLYYAESATYCINNAFHECIRIAV